MKNCLVWGEMSSDRASEQYPEELVCEQCLAEQINSAERSEIVTVVGDADASDGAQCVFCGKTKEDEDSESA